MKTIANIEAHGKDLSSAKVNNLFALISRILPDFEDPKFQKFMRMPVLTLYRHNMTRCRYLASIPSCTQLGISTGMSLHDSVPG